MYDEHLQLDKELVHQGYLMNEIDFVKCECVRIFFFFQVSVDFLGDVFSYMQIKSLLRVKWFCIYINISYMVLSYTDKIITF